MKNTKITSVNTAGMRRKREFKDRLANLTIGLGGVGVIAAICLIFFYLVFEVWPLFSGADLEKKAPVQTQAVALYLDADEYNESGIRVLADGQVQILDVKTGKIESATKLPLPEKVHIAHVQRGPILSGLVGIGLSNGQLLVAKPKYDISYGPNNSRIINTSLAFPYGETPLTVDRNGAPLQVFDVRGNDEDLRVTAFAEGRVQRLSFSTGAEASSGLSLSFGDDDADNSNFTEVEREDLPYAGRNVQQIIVGQDGNWAYVFHDGNRASVFNVRNEPIYTQEVALTGPTADVTAVVALQGNVSLMVGDSSGELAQWFMVRDSSSGSDSFNLQKIRSIKLGDAAITALAPEARRKGVVAGDANGNVSYYYTTSNRLILQESAGTSPIRTVAMSARSLGLMVQTDNAYSFWKLEIEHPDISIQSTWKPVWYESYEAPTYTWQSSSGTADFESKLSLMPLTFGTIKAAFYAMLLGAPLAIFGAMYSAVFMSPKLRRKVKPTIELMEALPTVILGFLAGLWLAPTIEDNLPGIFSLLILTPITIVLVGGLWSRLPLEKRAFADGWAPMILIVPLLITGYASFAFSQPIENMFFGGDLRSWLEVSTGLNFDQRNSLIVGLAMGFAVIPNIYAIAEDALFAVPKHLTNGSLALGATQWQTLIRVVLPTASPGIFSALMIGLGRAVGETMIVLMATGNTAIMDWNIFEGMRTLSANVAVEMGEAEVGSTHFRVLFLSALVLFVLTFILNTVAEVIRTRLRKKYGSL